jgi:hypothetical protein
MSATAVLWIGVAVACCGFCIYGINRAIHRSRESQAKSPRAVTH